MNCFSGLHGSGLNALGYGVIRTGASTVRVFPLVFLVSPAQGLLLVCVCVCVCVFVCVFLNHNLSSVHLHLDRMWRFGMIFMVVTYLTFNVTMKHFITDAPCPVPGGQLCSFREHSFASPR